MDSCCSEPQVDKSARRWRLAIIVGCLVFVGAAIAVSALAQACITPV